MTTATKIQPAPYVLIPLASEITGLTPKAITRKIEDGVWLEGKEYRKGPDGRIYISLKGYEKWVEKGFTSGAKQSASNSRATENRNGTH